ncbi:beta-ketoacyl synthase N-terminal-like domain-containing protein [Streptomyces sp. NPDC001514]
MSVDNAVAVVGMACRLPGAEDVGRYWDALVGGVDGISRFTPQELLAQGVDPDYVGRENFVPAMGVIAGSRRFDRAFFRYSRAEAAAMDPQQRVFLECASTAVDDAGIDPTRFPGRVGVYAGADRVGFRSDDELGELARYIGQEKDFLATRVAYKLGLRGPALTVQTACSTSLTAVHLAVRALVGGECDAALAGGVTVMPGGEWGYLFEPGGILSPDGHCRPFDEHAAGTVPSEGVAVVVLKRLADALHDGDRIAAVITGTAVNNDGSDKMAYTAPSIAGQSEVIRAAQRIAGVDPADIDYVEAHGTATRLGDPVEVQALTDAFGGVGGASAATGRCLLGAVKGNIGHTGVVSGVAGLIKTALMMERGQIVPTAHFTGPNPLLDLESSPFRIAASVEPWPDRGTRLAAVSSFGVGGTNAHVLLQGAPSRAPRVARPGPRPLTLSAATPEALGRLAAAIADRLEPAATDEDAPALAEVARTLAERRVHRHRRALVAADTSEAVRLLRGVSATAGSAEAARVGAPTVRGATAVQGWPAAWDATATQGTPSAQHAQAMPGASEGASEGAPQAAQAPQPAQAHSQNAHNAQDTSDTRTSTGQDATHNAPQPVQTQNQNTQPTQAPDGPPAARDATATQAHSQNAHNAHNTPETRTSTGQDATHNAPQPVQTQNQNTQAAQAPDGPGAGADARAVATAGARPKKLGKVAFLFPGQGTLRHGAGAAAYQLLPAFRAAFDEIRKAVRDAHDIELSPVVTDAPAPPEDWFADTVHQQLGLFALGYAFGRQLEAWNVRPAAMLGNSVGEYVAATLAGVWAPEAAADLVCRRARAMWDTEPGRMVSIGASAEEVASRLPVDCKVTIAVEGAGSVVLSGPEAAVTDLLAGEALAGIPTTLIHTRRAFHSKAMEPAAEAVRATISSMPARPPRQPLVSNTTGDWADPQEVAGPDYWAAQLRRPVLLAAAMSTLLDSGCTTYIELGPGSSMIGGLRRSAGWDIAYTAVRLTSRPEDPADAGLLAALATLWERGVDRALDDVLGTLHGAPDERPLRCSLPGHPFLGEDPEAGHEPGPARRPEPRVPAVSAPESRTPARTSRTPAPSREAAAVRGDGVRPVLEELWCRTLGVPVALDDDNFFALGGESLMAVSLTTRVRERTGCVLSVTDFSRAPSFGELVEAVERQLPAPSDGSEPSNGSHPANPQGPFGGGAMSAVPGVATLSEGGSDRPLFLVSDATGNALAYRTLADLLGLAGDRPVLGLEDTGHPRSHSRPRTIEAIAADHVTALLRAQPEGPYTIGGWSFGAVVAHEMVRRLSRRGERVDLLVCLDGFVPDTGGLPMACAPAFLRASVRAQAEAALGVGPLARQVRRSPALRRQFIANQATLLRYRPRPVPCPAVLFKASSGRAEAGRLRERLSGLYWGGIRVEPVGGDHWSMLTRPYAGDLALKLLDVLPADSTAGQGEE